MMRSLLKSVFCVLAAVISISAAAADASALMRLDLKDGKVMAQIPKSLLGRRLMMATRIEQTSDSGEGARDVEVVRGTVQRRVRKI